MKLTKEEMLSQMGSIDLAKDINDAIRHQARPKNLEEVNEEYHQMEAVTRDVLASLKKHGVNIMQAYMITGAISDALYAMMLDASLREKMQSED